MSRPINSKNLVINSGSISQNISQSTVIPAALSCDSLTVNTIYLVDSLYTKNTKNVNALNKLQISQGSIVNVYNSTNANLKTLKYNNVYFLPDIVDSNIVTLYTNNVLNIGVNTNQLNLIGSNISISPTYNLNVQNQSIFSQVIINKYLLANCDVKINGNLIVQGDILYNTANITGNLKVGGNIILNNKILMANSNTNFLEYNGNNVVTITRSNILSASNILIIDPTGKLDTMFEVVGNITCNSVYLTSDIRKKKNIRDISSEEINNLNELKSYNFDLKSSNNNNYGFMAHEVANLFPMLSTGDTVNYIGFIPLLLEKIKILEERVKILECFTNSL
jgi:hypothetical protein